MHFAKVRETPRLHTITELISSYKLEREALDNETSESFENLVIVVSIKGKQDVVYKSR